MRYAGGKLPERRQFFRLDEKARLLLYFLSRFDIKNVQRLRNEIRYENSRHASKNFDWNRDERHGKTGRKYSLRVLFTPL